MGGERGQIEEKKKLPLIEGAERNRELAGIKPAPHG
jgi:hypothetical protein